ncbi:MAG: fumarylacetoacetate hydrolase family protein [Rhodocyclaceae bacterium]|nr:fumarylacetoacetate hydrolase family protein [Rhodocyclaceae bacterium]MBP6109397.1 fumarylacetoacetate hydrolase family protein [Rhodocyclaceae bacterium]
MKLLRYGSAGHEQPGMLDTSGQIRALSSIVPQIDSFVLSPRELVKLRKIKPESLPVVKGYPRLGVPFIGIGKFIGVGLNYADHAAEANLPIPGEPILFSKATTCLSGPNDNVIMPKGATKLDWEVELGIVIGSKAQYVEEANALDYVAGYCVVNDISERNFQMERGSQWDRGKGCDTFGPVGPYLITTDEIRNPQTLGMWLDVNGQNRQHGNTETMVFGCAYLVSYISQFMTLLPGDIITTGTPPGVGLGMKPPTFLKVGDVMTLGIEGLGQQRQTVVAYAKQ